MKVVLVNGSPHEKGCTFTALCEVQKTLEQEKIDTEIFWIGTKPLSGCIACRKCESLGQCVFDDCVNDFLSLARSCDGFIFGSPVYWASATGPLTSFMDRVFFADACSGKKLFYLKPAASVISTRRAGATTTFDQINKYFTLKQMPLVSSQYWHMVHGMKPEEVQKDLEGLQTMRTLGRNMAFLLKCLEAGKKAGVPLPEVEPPIRTNFIRD